MAVETAYKVVDTLHVVQQEFGAKVAVSDAEAAGDIHLAFHLAQRPVALAWVKHIYAQSTDDGTSVAEFLPVNGKGIEIVVLEIYYWVELIY